MIARYDYWVVPEADSIRESCGQLLWKAKARHAAGDLAFVSRPVSLVEQDGVRIHLCTNPSRLFGLSMGPIIPVIPFPVPYGLEGTSPDEELGVVAFNRHDSRPIRIDPAFVRLRDGMHELPPRRISIGSARCTDPQEILPPALVLDPGGVVTFCFASPEASVDELRLDLWPEQPTLTLERDRGTFLFVLE